MLSSEDFHNFLDADGLLSPHYLSEPEITHGSSGNGILYTAELMLAVYKRGRMTPENREIWTAIMRGCQVEPGLFKRSPLHTDQEGPDDYVGLVAAAKICEPRIAKEVLNYGRSSRTPLRGLLAERSSPVVAWLFDRLLGWITVRFNFNNVRPGTMHRSSWLGRQPQLVAHFYYGAGETPPLFYQAWWALVVATTGIFASGQDSWILSWLLVQTAGDASLLNRVASWFWWRSFKKAYPTIGVGLESRIGTVLRDYFNCPHPLCELILD